MIYLYLGSLVLGGVLLGSSLVLGGHGDAAAAEAGGGLEHDPGHPDLAGPGAADFLVGAFTSLRFWTFFTAFFGLTGLVLGGLGLLGSQVLVALLAVVMGLGSGLGAVYTLRKLDSVEESSSLGDVGEYVGKTGRVLVAISPGQTGKVRLQVRGSTVDVLAKTDDASIAVGDEAIVLELEGTTVRVAPYDAGTTQA